MPMILYNQVMAQKNQRRSLPQNITATESENEKLNIHIYATSQAVWQTTQGGMALSYRPSPHEALTLKPNHPIHGGNHFNPITPNFSKSKLTLWGNYVVR